MGCSTCAVSKDGTPTGCGNKGHCNSGSCNKMNTYDWLTTMELNDPSDYHIVEVSFKKGTRKAFYMNAPHTRAITGDMVVLEASTGHDVGRITLSGDLVRAQMKKKKTPEERVIHSVVRKANERDLQKLQDARNKEKPAMIKARQLARSIGLEMKIGEVEYQGDLRKATFYYIADGRVDFRELVRMYAKEFRVKIEMRQIGSRQESGLVGGVGACGRELCCSTWLSDFSTVTTSAARYQNIAINQTKLSGQCGRLKCCLNYELDMYIEALSEYPRKVDMLRTKNGNAYLMKVDIFSQLMYYTQSSDLGRNIVIPLTKEQVLEYKAMNDKGIKPEKLEGVDLALADNSEKADESFADVTGEIELPDEKKRGRGRNRKGRKGNKPKNKQKNKGEKGKGNTKDNKGPKGKSNKPNNKSNKPKDGKGKSNKPNNKSNQGGNNKPTGKSNNNPGGKNKKGPHKGGPKKDGNNKSNNDNQKNK